MKHEGRAKKVVVACSWRAGSGGRLVRSAPITLELLSRLPLSYFLLAIVRFSPCNCPLYLCLLQDAIRSRISLGSSPGSNDRRTVIKAELDALRTEQGKFKADRGRTLDEVKRLQENVQKKIKDAQASRGKLSYKSVGEIDDRIQ